MAKRLKARAATSIGRNDSPGNRKAGLRGAASRSTVFNIETKKDSINVFMEAGSQQRRSASKEERPKRQASHRRPGTVHAPPAAGAGLEQQATAGSRAIRTPMAQLSTKFDTVIPPKPQIKTMLPLKGALPKSRHISAKTKDVDKL